MSPAAEKKELGERKREREKEQAGMGYSTYYNAKQYNTILSHHTLTPIYCLCLLLCL